MAKKKEFWYDGLTRKNLENTRVVRMTIKFFTHTHVHYFEGFNVELLSALINEADDMLNVESIKIDKV